MIDHVGIRVSDYERSKRFFVAAFAPLGVSLLEEVEGRRGGFGYGPLAEFWISSGLPSAGLKISFRADRPSAVDSFHEAAVAAGGRSSDSPELRVLFKGSYYTATVSDPDNYQIEVTCATDSDLG